MGDAFGEEEEGGIASVDHAQVLPSVKTETDEAVEDAFGEEEEGGIASVDHAQVLPSVKTETDEVVEDAFGEEEEGGIASVDHTQAGTKCAADDTDAELKLQKEVSDAQEEARQVKVELETTKSSLNDAAKAKSECEVGEEAKLKSQKEAQARRSATFKPRKLTKRTEVQAKPMVDLMAEKW